MENKRSLLLKSLLHRPRSVLHRYGFALIAISVSMSITMLLEDLRHGNLYSINLAATALATAYGGLGPGLLAGAVASLGIDYYFIEPYYSIELQNPINLFRTLLYGVASFFISWLIDSLHKAYDMADRNRRAREELLAILSHDLRSPLAGIRLSAQAIRHSSESRDSDKINELSDAIVQTTARLNQLIVDILDATKLESGKILLSISEHHVNGIVSDAIGDLREVAKETGVRFAVELSPEDGKLSCDRVRILQVLSNLIGNAIKFSPENGTIRVDVGRDGSQWRFGVADEGPGIPSVNLAHIFEKHWQPREHRGKGIGLGLYIAKGIVEAHGGTIWAQSEPGSGTLFYFALPGSEPSLASEMPKGKSQQSS